MSLTRPIPTDAMPVVEILRRDVLRPTTLPMPMNGLLRWENGCCAMGLAPRANAVCPYNRFGFGYPNEILTYRVVYFANWFDEQTDPQATVDAIWPTGDGEKR
jgi:hypothetical protein